MPIIPRAASSAVLRSAVVRPAARGAPLRLRAAQMQQVRRQSEDIGGPGESKELPPRQPGDPEPAKRNWVAIGGAALLVVAMYAYLTRPPPKGDPLTKSDSTDAKAGPNKLPPVREEGRGVNLAKRMEDKESSSLSQLSGRKKTEFGAFRAE